MSDYTAQEMMVAVASREIRDGDLVFVGMRLPILAYGVARSTHAPRARALYEPGLLLDRPPAGFLGTLRDPPNVPAPPPPPPLPHAPAQQPPGPLPPHS